MSATNISYDYDLPKGLIADEPAEPRDSARLLVYKTKSGEIIEDIFANISRYVPENSLLVLNDTKVMPARLELTKATGGKVNILFLLNEWRQDDTIHIKGLPDKKLNIGDRLYIHASDEVVSGQIQNLADMIPLVKIVAQNKEEFTFELLINATDFRGILNKSGHTPLPPYIHSSLTEKEARERYQTIFSRGSSSASVAAPTASLHFSDSVFASLKSKNIVKTFVTLDVGRGTFSPVDMSLAKDNVASLHSEPIFVSMKAVMDIARAKKEGRLVITSGTTATRVVESLADRIIADHTLEDRTDISDTTSIFIRPPYNFKITDGLITNFHLPNTSLLMLLDAFLQYKKSPKSWRDIYEYAIEKGYRFYSFGDAMLVI